MDAMARFGRLLTRRAGPIGLAMTAFDVWRRIPPKHRKRIIAGTRKHGPKVAARLIAGRKRR
jgi:hypothetical protein